MTRIHYITQSISILADIFDFAVSIGYMVELLNINFFSSHQFRDIEYVESMVDERE